MASSALFQCVVLTLALLCIARSAESAPSRLPLTQNSFECITRKLDQANTEHSEFGDYWTLTLDFWSNIYVKVMECNELNSVEEHETCEKELEHIVSWESQELQSYFDEHLEKGEKQRFLRLLKGYNVASCISREHAASSSLSKIDELLLFS